MKRICTFFMVVLIVTTFAACRNNIPAVSAMPTDKENSIAASRVFDGLMLEDNCKLSLDGTVAWPNGAFAYEVQDEMMMSADDIAAVLLGGKYESKSDGNFENDDFTLSISGSSIRLTGKGEKVRGIVEHAVPYDSAEYDSPGYQRRGISKADYGTENLPFMSMENAAVEVKTVLNQVGLKNLELHHGFALDKETIMKNIKKSVEYALDDFGDSAAEVDTARLQSLAELEYDDEDECYFFIFEMRLDDIPVLTGTSTQTQREISGAEICCLYSKDGLVDITAKHVPYSVTATGERQLVIAPGEAAKALLAQFNATEEKLNIGSVRLCYAYYNKEYSRLTPTWVFIASCERNPSTIENKTYTYYLYYAVNALTGEMVVYDIRM